jgi:hypothetical protein
MVKRVVYGPERKEKASKARKHHLLWEIRKIRKERERMSVLEMQMPALKMKICLRWKIERKSKIS